MELVLSSLAGALAGLIDLLLRLAVPLALPLALVLSALLLSAVLLYRRDRDRFAFLAPGWPAVTRSLARTAATTLLLLGGWGLLSAALPAVRHVEWFHDHARIEAMLLDGTATPVAGFLHPDLSRPGLGVELRHRDAERWAA